MLVKQGEMRIEADSVRVEYDTPGKAISASTASMQGLFDTTPLGAMTGWLAHPAKAKIGKMHQPKRIRIWP